MGPVRALLPLSVFCLLSMAEFGSAEPLPFHYKAEVYRNHDGDVIAFSLRLEQAFLAEEFEKSNYLRLHPQDTNAYLIYPRETKFQQKHAEFYGRLRGQGKVKLRLSYETVSENPDGSRRLDVHNGDLEIVIPPAPGGPESIFQDWAKRQNDYFAQLLNYYPDNSFFQYVLLQSRSRYGVSPPPLAKAVPDRPAIEANLYDVLTGSLAIQETLQRQTLNGSPRQGDLSVHISTLNPPALKSLDYAKLLEEKRVKYKSEPHAHRIARLIPADQYFLHFNSVKAAGDLLDLANDWGDQLLRLFQVQAQDNRLQAKLEDQLCVRRGPLTKLFADGVVAELAVTGSDPFVLEGTDVTMVFRLKSRAVFQAAATEWLAQARAKHPGLTEREFNYRGHRIAARYTNDRVVSSFVVDHGDYVIFSNSHAAIRKMVDAATGKVAALHDALDYRYVTTILPPADGPQSGFLFASEAFVKRMVGPEAKIAEKRRLQCFNNLVMLNNASMFYRLEYGKSPASLNDLIQGRFIDANRIVCPHGGAYALDARQDTCTCSLHNRLKYLTPIAELPVLKVSNEERDEYERYKRSYQAFWGTAFDPIAVRITAGPRAKLEVCVLPFANGSLYTDLRDWLDAKARPLETDRIAPSAVASLVAVRGRKNIADFLADIPGIPEALAADPTITDLSWLGDRMSIHLCDGDMILEVDPARLPDVKLPLLGKPTLTQQFMLAAGLAGTQLPAYLAIDVEDTDKATRLLDLLSSKIFLQKGHLFGLPTKLDAYRLPDYAKHPVYVLTYRVEALKIRLHVAVVDHHLIAATKPEIVREIIDASTAPRTGKPVEAHLMLRFNRRALNRLAQDFGLYWEEKARLACHHNAASITNLLMLYDDPAQDVSRLAEAKYGVRYFCPDHGTYAWDDRHAQVECSVHGNRQRSRQKASLTPTASFAEFIRGLDEIIAALRFQDDALIATIEIARRQGENSNKTR